MARRKLTPEKKGRKKFTEKLKALEAITMLILQSESGDEEEISGEMLDFSICGVF